jgi:transcriptional regulator with XRE-family HTH domain
MKIENELIITTESDEQALAQRLREAREYLGLPQELVAEKLGIPRPAVSAIETGKRKVSSLELKQLAHLYRQSISHFLGTQDDSDAHDELLSALYRATQPLSNADKEQVLRFAAFLRAAEKPPAPTDGVL